MSMVEVIYVGFGPFWWEVMQRNENANILEITQRE